MPDTPDGPVDYTPPQPRPAPSGEPMVTVPLRYFELLCASYYGSRAIAEGLARAHAVPPADASGRTATDAELTNLRHAILQTDGLGEGWHRMPKRTATVEIPEGTFVEEPVRLPSEVLLGR